MSMIKKKKGVNLNNKNRISSFIHNKYKLIIAFVLGVILMGTGVYAATVISSEQVLFDNTNAGLKIGNENVDNVQDALDALHTKVETQLNTCATNLADYQYASASCQIALAAAEAAVPATCANPMFQLGDYIDMTPTGASFQTDLTYTNGTRTTIYPSDLKVWRVIKINPNCTVEVVSEYVSSVTNRGVYFKGNTGYKNYVYYLNEVAKHFTSDYTLDPSTAPNGAFRNVGYSNQTEQITNTTRLDSASTGASGGAWYQKPTPLNKEESLGGGDDGYTNDLKLLGDAGVNIQAYGVDASGTVSTSYMTYWIASRLYRWTTATTWVFAARVSSDNDAGPISSTSLFTMKSSGSKTESTYQYKVRPIVTLDPSRIEIASGLGTSSSHYQLSLKSE